MASSRLMELTEIISANTKKINDFFHAEGIQGLSFDVNAPTDFPVPSSNVEIQAARRAVVNATQELRDLMVGPRETVRWLAWSYNDNLSLQALYEFKIAQAVPTDGDVSYADIAVATGLDETNAKRLIRHAMTNRIFTEPRPGYVAHTAASRVLRDDPSMVDWVGVCSSEFYQASAKTVEALRKFPNSQEANEAGYAEYWCPGKPMFAVMGADPVRAKRFGGAMVSLTGGEGYEPQYLVDNYDWEGLGEATVVDVGGSFGFICVALAKKYPKLKFVVQDLPKVVANGPEKIPPEFADRIKFEAHDFYTEQTQKGADVFFFRWICHNQSDKYGVKMLKALIPALKPGARIVISDNCLKPVGELDMWDEKITRSMDLTMLSLLNAKERDVPDWIHLFAQADPRFKFLGAKTPEGSRMSIMEAVWEG
ncbi:uncharacterized protein PV09_00631 [Verruconis gallopava]|uniref:O-methyltransferase C-terminal domain-containing protein n=1 Tax=Verruconis gallopava TaxID=253628 RepID=A0A0D2AQ94_9PEZI|nr:uncharacterized protein PV09_00631 [Verruconis gallopava]KIW08680.1 hypothetical protein PV09_00631 [Verruconis gallopava]